MAERWAVGNLVQKHPLYARSLCHPFLIGCVQDTQVMEQGSSDMYKLVKKMNTDKGVPEHMMKSWAQVSCNLLSLLLLL